MNDDVIQKLKIKVSSIEILCVSALADLCRICEVVKFVIFGVCTGTMSCSHIK